VADASVLHCGPLIQTLKQDLGISGETVARALDVDRPTLARWITDDRIPQGKTRKGLAELLALRDRMLAVLGSAERARSWLRTSSTYLGGFTPEEALRAGRIDRVSADLDGLAAGVYL